MNLVENTEKLRYAFFQRLDAPLAEVQTLEDLYREYFGKKGAFSQILAQIPSLSTVEEKRAVGKSCLAIVEECKKKHEEKRQSMKQNLESKLLKEDFFDVLRPIDMTLHRGSLHPITQVQERVEEIFSSLMGFQIVDGPEIETDAMNFERLNFSDDHPARDMQDTIWTENRQWLMRTHTSSVQTRVMEVLEPPLRVIAPGRCFRFEETDASHDHTFHQVEGMMIEEDLSVVDLIQVMRDFLDRFFGKKIAVRLRPGFFPFVEPGFELDIACLLCSGRGCTTCKRSGWLELLPCGLVHPNVLRAGNISTQKFSGLAFGLGMDRLVMMLYGVEDIRHFMSGNVRFLQQF